MQEARLQVLTAAEELVKAVNMFSAPLDVCLGITSICNLSCKHCMNRNVSSAEPDMTTDELLQVVGQLAEARVFYASIFGGEPLMHPDFFRIVEQFNKYPIQLFLNTNATLVEPETAKWLKEHKITGIIASLDGSTPEIMDRLRGPGAFEKAVKGIEHLLSSGLPVELSVTVTKINYQDIRGLVLLGRKLKARLIRFNHIFFGGNAACFINEVYLTPEEEQQVINEVWQIKQEFPGFLDERSSYPVQKEKLDELTGYQPSKDKIVVPPCGAAQRKCYIRPDGWVTPCETIWDAKCGNVKQEKLTEIWARSSMMNQFREPMELDLKELPECVDCQYQYLCFIGHRCYPYYYPGGVKNKELYCRIKQDKQKVSKEG